MRLRHVYLAAALAAVGCLWGRESRREPADPLRVGSNRKLEQANLAACTRVDALGRRLLAANPELPQGLLFCAAGYPSPELFHRGTSSVVVTQKVVEMCPSDGELAAVLCVELGRLVAEREALAPLEARQPAPRPPIDPVTFRSTSGVANPDELRLRELARYEKEQRRQSARPTLLDPMELARQFLTKAGFAAEELEKVKPVLRAAGANSDLEAQMNSSPAATPFAPPGGP